MKTVSFAVIGLALISAAPAMAAGRCLQYGNIYNFKALDDKTLIVEDDFHDRYKLTLLSICPTLTFKEGIGFRSFGPTMALSCVSAGDDIVTRDPTGGQRCSIKKVEPYTAEMMKTDADAAAAKKAAGGSH